MKQFSSIVIGGMLTVFVMIGLYKMAVFLFPGISSQAVAQAEDTSDLIITKSTNEVLYSASEEEDLVNATIEALPPRSRTKITAKSYLVKNLTTGDVVIGQETTRLMPIASLTKLVTAVVVRRYIPSDVLMEIDPIVIKNYGNSSGFRPKEIFTVDDMLHPLLMVSSNDAAEMLARKYGNRKSFIQAMNDFAQSIGAYKTYFRDPTGLSKYNESSASDQAIILDWIRRNDPYILNITSLKSKTIRSHTWTNPTHFLSWSYYRGGKNGFTNEANRTSASLFQLGESKHIYAVILLGSENRDADMIQLIDKIEKLK